MSCELEILNRAGQRHYHEIKHSNSNKMASVAARRHQPQTCSVSNAKSSIHDKAQTYVVAHTAQCKLKLAADRPDRNLRFLLGHAFTFDKVMYRIAEIEGMGHVADDEPLPKKDEAAAAGGKERRVSFHDNSAKPTGDLMSVGTGATGITTGRRSPPPPKATANSDDGDKTDSDDDYDDGEEDGFGLTRFQSASAQQPKDLASLSLADKAEKPKNDTTSITTAEKEVVGHPKSTVSTIHITPSPRTTKQRSKSPPPPPPPELSDTDDSEDDSDGDYELETPPTSPESVPSDDELRDMFAKAPEGDEEMEDLYESVANCGCQHHRGHNRAPEVGSIWQIKQEREAKRARKVRAVIRFA